MWPPDILDSNMQGIHRIAMHSGCLETSKIEPSINSWAGIPLDTEYLPLERPSVSCGVDVTWLQPLFTFVEITDYTRGSWMFSLPHSGLGFQLASWFRQGHVHDKISFWMVPSPPSAIFLWHKIPEMANSRFRIAPFEVAPEDGLVRFHKMIIHVQDVWVHWHRTAFEFQLASWFRRGRRRTWDFMG